jgi:Tfp pilus tip-associated adhesin PilY1
MYADEIPSGSLMPGRGGTFQTPLLTVGGPSSMAQRNTALHELQHAIQQKEGFSPGGSPSNMITELEKIAKQKVLRSSTAKPTARRPILRSLRPRTA